MMTVCLSRRFANILDGGFSLKTGTSETTWNAIYFRIRLYVRYIWMKLQRRTMEGTLVIKCLHTFHRSMSDQNKLIIYLALSLANGRSATVMIQTGSAWQYKILLIQISLKLLILPVSKFAKRVDHLNSYNHEHDDISKLDHLFSF